MERAAAPAGRAFAPACLMRHPAKKQGGFFVRRAFRPTGPGEEAA